MPTPGLDAAEASRLFAAIRAIKKSVDPDAVLTQTDVDMVNRALLGDVAEIARTGMRASQKCIDLIHSFETLKLKAYKDPGSKNGLPITNGWGSTRDEDGGPIQLGAIWTKTKADRLFARELIVVENGVNLLIGKAPTTQCQFDAMVSFAYNVGLDIDDDTLAEGLGDSTLLKHHLAGRYAQAEAAFASWKYNDGKVMNGLIRRRAAEAAMYGGR
jgi:lysozyme